MTTSSSAPDVSWRPDAYIGDLTIAMKRENGVVSFRVQREQTLVLGEREFDEYGKAVSALYSVLDHAPVDVQADTPAVPAVPAQNEQMSLL